MKSKNSLLLLLLIQAMLAAVPGCSGLPGVPGLNSPDRNSFDVSFWAGLYSGFIYSIFTGFFVGIAVWLVQKQADNRRLCYDLEREIVLFRDRLRRALSTPTPLVIGHSIVNIEPQCAVEVAKLLDGQPLELWRCHIPKYRSFVSLIDTFSRAHEEYLVVGRKLEICLINFIRRHNDSRHVSHIHDNPHQAFFLARIRGLASTDITPWLLYGYTPPQAELDSAYELARSDASIMETADSYLSALAKLQNAVDALNGSLTQGTEGHSC